MRPHPRRTRTNPTAPSAWGTCDRSGFVSMQRDLQWQYAWQGTRLVNLRILVASDQVDTPNRQLGTIILPPDPISITNARPEIYPIDELWEVMLETGNEHGSLPVYLEVSTVGAAQPTKASSLELSTIQMDDANTS